MKIKELIMPLFIIVMAMIFGFSLDIILPINIPM